MPTCQRAGCEKPGTTRNPEPAIAQWLGDRTGKATAILCSEDLTDLRRTARRCNKWDDDGSHRCVLGAYHQNGCDYMAVKSA